MPPRLGPFRLDALAKEKILDMVEEFLDVLASNLAEAPRRHPCRDTITMKQLCRVASEVSKYVYGVPQPALNLMSHELLELFGKAALRHFFFLPTMNYKDSEELFKLALDRSLEVLNLRDLSSEILSLWAVGSLRRVSRVKVLLLPNSFVNSGAIARNVCDLHWLQELEYPIHCSDAVIKALSHSNNCLARLRVQGSRGVTNACVRYLRRHRMLTFLDLSDTRVDIEKYALLLRLLPLVENIRWSKNVDALAGETSLDLARIRTLDARLSEPRRMFVRCVNVESLSLTLASQQDLSPLLQINQLKQLRLRKFDYEKTFLVAVFLHVGKTLQELELRDMTNVDPTDVVNFCPALVTLTFEFCTFVPKANVPLTGQEHYRNLRHVTVVYSQPEFNYTDNLRHYKGLQSLTYLSHHLDDDFVERSIEGLKTLEVFSAFSHKLAYRTLVLIIRRCQNIREIGYLNCWKSISNAQLRFITNEIMYGNYDLQIKL